MYLCKYTIPLVSIDKHLFVFYYVYIIKYKFQEVPVYPSIVYLKDHNRMPVRFGIQLPFRDLQAELPRGWCTCCGSEVFQEGQERCIHCRKAKGENTNAT